MGFMDGAVFIQSEGMAAGRESAGPEVADALTYQIAAASRPAVGQRLPVLQAARAAVMSLARTADGGVLPLFSGHGEGPGPARPGDHRHVYIAALDGDGDGRLDQILIIAPWRVDRGVVPTDDDRADFARVTDRLTLVRAGAAGVLTLGPPLPLARKQGRVWHSRTPYRPTRHPAKGAAKGADAAAFVIDDVRRECLRKGLPAPDTVQPLMVRAGPRGGLSTRLRLAFAEPVAGPVLLGRDAHRGGGLFSAGVPPA